MENSQIWPQSVNSKPNISFKNLCQTLNIKPATQKETVWNIYVKWCKKKQNRMQFQSINEFYYSKCHRFLTDKGVHINDAKALISTAVWRNLQSLTKTKFFNGRNDMTTLRTAGIRKCFSEIVKTEVFLCYSSTQSPSYFHWVTTKPMPQCYFPKIYYRTKNCTLLSWIKKHA